MAFVALLEFHVSFGEAKCPSGVSDALQQRREKRSSPIPSILLFNHKRTLQGLGVEEVNGLGFRISRAFHQETVGVQFHFHILRSEKKYVSMMPCLPIRRILSSVAERRGTEEAVRGRALSKEASPPTPQANVPAYFSPPGHTWGQHASLWHF